MRTSEIVAKNNINFFSPSRILLDTSEENKSDYVDELRKVLKKLDVRLETVLISHWHHDHVGSAGAIHSDKNLHADHGA